MIGVYREVGAGDALLSPLQGQVAGDTESESAVRLRLLALTAPPVVATTG